MNHCFIEGYKNKEILKELLKLHSKSTLKIHKIYKKTDSEIKACFKTDFS